MRVQLSTLKRPEFLILILAVFFRLWTLDVKPPHFDEGINGWFVDQLINNGYYRYDPNNYHGPLYFYILWFFKFLMGRSIWALRVPPVLFSIATIWLIFKYDKFFSKRVCLWAAALFALSPLRL